MALPHEAATESGRDLSLTCETPSGVRYLDCWLPAASLELMRAYRGPALGLTLIVLLLAGMYGCSEEDLPVSNPFPAPASPGDAQAPHVMVIVLENREYGEVIGSAEAPFLNQIASRFGLATEFYATTHPSLPNYIELISGATHGITTNCTSCSAQGDTIADQLTLHGISWRAYMEGMPSPCFLGASTSAGYEKKHNPFLYFNSIREDREQCQRVVPYSYLVDDLNAGTAPPFLWITPNGCNSGHDCSTSQADKWLSSALPPIMASTWFAHNGLIIITWDEGSSNLGCCGSGSGGHIATLLVSERSSLKGTIDGPLNHAGLLRSVESLYGLPYLGEAACPCSGELPGLR